MANGVTVFRDGEFNHVEDITPDCKEQCCYRIKSNEERFRTLMSVNIKNKADSLIDSIQNGSSSFDIYKDLCDIIESVASLQCLENDELFDNFLIEFLQRERQHKGSYHLGRHEIK